MKCGDTREKVTRGDRRGQGEKRRRKRGMFERKREYKPRKEVRE